MLYGNYLYYLRHFRLYFVHNRNQHARFLVSTITGAPALVTQCYRLLKIFLNGN